MNTADLNWWRTVHWLQRPPRRAAAAIADAAGSATRRGAQYTGRAFAVEGGCPLSAAEQRVLDGLRARGEVL